MHDEPIYHIVPAYTGWQVILGGDVLKVFVDRASAERYLKRIAHMAGDVRVTVHPEADDYGEEFILHRDAEGNVEAIYDLSGA